MDDSARVLGCLDKVSWGPEDVRFVGWSVCPEVTLGIKGHACTVRPSIWRADVIQAGYAAARGFSGHIAGRDTHLTVSAPGGEIGFRKLIAQPGPLPRIASEARTVTAFLALLWHHRREIRTYLGTGDLQAARLLRNKTGLFGDDTSRILSHDVFEPWHRAPAPVFDAPVHIILPVHGSPDMVRRVVDRVQVNSELPYRLVIVDDASPEPEMSDLLDRWEWSAGGTIDVIRHSTNQGFVAAANAGLARAAAAKAHAVLLNSDAFPPPGWLSRLMAPIAQDGSVATVTPFSNTAEILTIPAPDRPAALGPEDGDRIDLFARQMTPELAALPVPVGIGFCMAMNARFLAQVQTLDPVFGRGYGEEVDWCRKVERLGGRHVAVANLFVQHEGSASFGSEEKHRRISANNAIVTQRYPHHDRDVQAFLERDPAFEHRFALALAHAAVRSTGPLPVYVAHVLGGGAETWLRTTIRLDQSRGLVPIVLRTGGPETWMIELHDPDGPRYASGTTTNIVQSLLSRIGPLALVYSCGVGCADPAGMIGLLLDLAKTPGSRLDVLFHDYLPLSPSYTLLDADGVFRGVPSPDSNDPAHQWTGVPGHSAHLSLRQWQALWSQVLEAADELTVFSRSSYDIVLQAHPTHAAKLNIRPHRTNHHSDWALPASGQRVIGVLGSINRAKGADLLQRLSRHLASQPNAPKLVLIGELDPSYALARPAVMHGAYRNDAVPQLARRYGVACWLMPSVWPETFSYATHEMLATGLPVHAFDLGAQGETVRAAANGHVLSASPGDVDGLLDEILARMEWT